MTNSTYYNLSLVEGTDVVNPLTVDVPNLIKIDEELHNNAVTGVTIASESTSGTVHALIRENSECSVIRFIATSEWKKGDSMTVDGVPVTTLLPSGEVLPNGAYVINANVMCILTGTNLTVYAEREKTVNSEAITYGNTNVKEQLDLIGNALTELTNNLNRYVYTETTEFTVELAPNTQTTVPLEPPVQDGYRFFPISFYMATVNNIVVQSLNTGNIRLWNNTSSIKSPKYTIRWLGIRQL